MDRRRFLKTTAKLGLLSAAPALPTLLIPRRARAATRAFGSASHLLVLYAQGGLRSHCLFNAMGTTQHNPFGAQPASSQTEWSLGAAFGDRDIETSGATVPGISKITDDIAVLACVDHAPNSPLPDVDHRTASARVATGDPLGSNGLLSIAGKKLPRYAEGFSVEAMPPVEVGISEWGSGKEDFARSRPLSLLSAAGGFAADLPVGRGWKIKARESLDQRFMAGRSKAFNARISDYLRSKAYAGVFADVLGDPLLDLMNQPQSSANGVSNQQLLEVLGSGTLAALGDTEGMPSWGANVAVALRFFAFGTPFCVVTNPIYDMHDNEAVNFRPRVMDLGRQLAGLNYLLKTMDHPEGGKFWERTVVVVLSEFSRNNTAQNGFNSGNGSDHVIQAPAPCRNQAVALMGGPVAGGRQFGATDENMNALDKVYSSRALLSTLLDLMGLSHEELWEDEPIGELFA